MHTFQRHAHLKASPEEVFAFHEDPRNIRKISPFFLRVLEVSADPVAIADSAFFLRLRVFGISVQWSGRWAVVRHPDLLVDVASRFPFQSWRHEHHFESIATGTRMVDVVTYSLPFGFIGWLAGNTIVRLQLTLMFLGRHRATKRYFAAQRRTKPRPNTL